MDDYKYSDFNLEKVSDVDELVELIKEDGNFTINEYLLMLNMAETTNQRMRIVYRLKRRVRPLTLGMHNRDSSSVKIIKMIRAIENKSLKTFVAEHKKALKLEEMKKKREEAEEKLKEKQRKRAEQEKIQKHRREEKEAKKLLQKNKVELKKQKDQRKKEEKKRLERQRKQQEELRKQEEKKRIQDIKRYGYIYVRFGFEWLKEDLQYHYIDIKKESYADLEPLKILSCFDANVIIPGEEQDISIYSLFNSKKERIKSEIFRYLTHVYIINLSSIEIDQRVYRFLSNKINTDEIFTDFLYIPMSDVLVKDGSIEVDFSNSNVLTSQYCDNQKYPLFAPNIMDFYKYLRDLLHFKNIGYTLPLIKKFYDGYMSFLLQKAREYTSMCFKTFMSKNNFEYLYRNEEIFTFSMNREGLPVWTPANHCNNNVDLFFQDVFSFDQSIKEWALETFDDVIKPLDKSQTDDCEELKKNFFRDMQIGVKSEFYYDVNNIPQEWRRNNLKVVSFYEDLYHQCNLYDDSYYNKLVYLVWSTSMNNNTIRLYTKNNPYKSIAFKFNWRKITSTQAAFIIINYFTCPVINKRSKALLTRYLVSFGIYNHYRFDSNVNL